MKDGSGQEETGQEETDPLLDLEMGISNVKPKDKPLFKKRKRHSGENIIGEQKYVFERHSRKRLKFSLPERVILNNNVFLLFFFALTLICVFTYLSFYLVQLLDESSKNLNQTLANQSHMEKEIPFNKWNLCKHWIREGVTNLPFACRTFRT